MYADIERTKKYLRSLGYTNDDIIFMMRHYGIDKFNSKKFMVNIYNDYQALIKLGFTPSEIIDMSKNSLLFNNSHYNIRDIIGYLKTLGFKSKDICDISTVNSHVFDGKVSDLNKTINDQRKKGLSYAEIINHTKDNPHSLSPSKRPCAFKVKKKVITKKAIINKAK